ncbi:MAG: RsmE family RNA methyltransferase [Acidobacteriota bacterium]
MNRFIGDFNLTGKSLSLTDRKLVNQVRNVLRMRAGESMILSDGKGKEVLAEILAVRKDCIDVRINGELKNLNEPSVHATLCCSILKKENFEWVVQKACEVGVREIIPLFAERTVKTRIHEERLKKIIKEAAEQSERKILPVLHPTFTFQDAVHRLKKGNLNLLFHRSGIALHDIKEKMLAAADRETKIPEVNYFIGPEGGWSDQEIRLAIDSDVTIVNLARLNLRAETAAVVAGYMICWKLFP